MEGIHERDYNKEEEKGERKKETRKKEENENGNTLYLARRTKTAPKYCTQKPVTRSRKRHYERDA